MRVRTKLVAMVVAVTLLYLPVPSYAQRGDDVALTAADISISSSGDNTVIAAVTGKKIEVYKIWFVTNAAVNIKFKDGASTEFNATAVPFTAQGSSMALPFDGKSYWGTTSGNAFVINLSGAVAVTGRIWYTTR
jgi:hypothetical protein